MAALAVGVLNLAVLIVAARVFSDMFAALDARLRVLTARVPRREPTEQEIERRAKESIDYLSPLRAADYGITPEDAEANNRAVRQKAARQLRDEQY
jgi:hypothetical protein